VYLEEKWFWESDTWSFGVTAWEIFTCALIPYIELSEDQMQVSFAEYSLFYRALLQERPIILRKVLIELSEDQMQVCGGYDS